MMNRSYGLTHHKLAQVVVDHNNSDNATNDILNNNNDVLIPQECNSCNNQSNIPHAIQITR